MVERLENALIAVNPSDTRSGSSTTPTRSPSARKLARYDKPAGQRALFQQTYPLAWGNTTVKPDYLLTGVVTVRPDLKSVTVNIEGFGPDSPKQDKVRRSRSRPTGRS